MKVYTVFSRINGASSLNDFHLVKEGFSWAGFVFSILWAAKKKMWALFFFITVVLGLLILLTKSFNLMFLDFFVILVWLSFVFGHFAFDLQRWSLIQRGFRFSGLILASSNEDAVVKFLERNGDLIASKANIEF